MRGGVVEPLPDQPTGNLLLEGDNLHWLTILQQTHKRKIDVIFIDPPYNGGRGLVYNDDYVDKEDRWIHSKWCTFMYKRLMLARDLLSDDGIIVITLDDDEQNQLRLMCDEIFGEKNFVSVIIWNKMTAKSDVKNVQHNHDYITIYAKNKRDKALLGNQKPKHRKVFRDEDGRFYYKGAGFTTGNNGTLDKRHNLGATVYYNPETKDFIAKQDYDVSKAKTAKTYEEIYTDDQDLISQGYIPIRAGYSGGKLRCWTWSVEKFNREKDRLVATPSKKAFSGYSLWQKEYVNSSKVIETENGFEFIDETSIQPLRSIIECPSSSGTKEMSAALGTKDFENPKPPALLEELFASYLPTQNATVFDFFAGSGSTAHAVERLNKKDGGQRNWIICTNNEGGEKDPNQGICRAITKPRIDAVITGIRPDGKKWADPLGGSYDYLTIEMWDRGNGQAYNTRKMSSPPPAVIMAALAEGIPIYSIVKEDSFSAVENNTKAVAVVSIAEDSAFKAAVEYLKNSGKDEVVLYTRAVFDYENPMPAIDEARKDGIEIKHIDDIISSGKYLNDKEQ